MRRLQPQQDATGAAILTGRLRTRPPLLLSFQHHGSFPRLSHKFQHHYHSRSIAVTSIVTTLMPPLSPPPPLPLPQHPTPLPPLSLLPRRLTSTAAAFTRRHDPANTRLAQSRFQQTIEQMMSQADRSKTASPMPSPMTGTYFLSRQLYTPPALRKIMSSGFCHPSIPNGPWRRTGPRPSDPVFMVMVLTVPLVTGLDRSAEAAVGGCDRPSSIQLRVWTGPPPRPIQCPNSPPQRQPSVPQGFRAQSSSKVGVCVARSGCCMTTKDESREAINPSVNAEVVVVVGTDGSTTTPMKTAMAAAL